VPFVGARPVTIQCAVCGKERVMPAAWRKKVTTPTCSRHCNGKLRALVLVKNGYRQVGPRGPNPKLQGQANPAWKGGVTLKRPKGNYKGVIYVRAPDWAKPMARKDGYIMEHRLVMATMCGFLLTRTEVVDHLDHNPSNNAPANLRLYPTNADHKRGERGRFVPGVANRTSLAV